MAFYYRAGTKSVTYVNPITHLSQTSESPNVPAGYEYACLKAPSGGGTQPWGVKCPVALPDVPPTGTNYVAFTYAQVVQFAVANGYTQAQVDAWGGWGP